MKTIACLCEDVTRDEVIEAIMLGYRDIESLKRFVGFGTGPCQGKQCIQFVREIMIEMGIDPGPGTTSRPPISPVPLALMAAEVEGDEKQL
jgi:sarcosine oxidase subunit beta